MAVSRAYWHVFQKCTLCRLFYWGHPENGQRMPYDQN